MKNALIILLAALAPSLACAQAASFSETTLVANIARCLVDGAPQGWDRLYMVVELAQPGDESGAVRYVAERGDAREAYVPCDSKRPAKTLIEARDTQPPERRGWTGARLVIHADGKFQLNYDYPK
jgi:hypothetical protein